MAFVAFFSWTSRLGLDEIIKREIVRDPPQTNRILGTSFFMKLSGGFLSVLLISVAINLIKTNDDLIIVVVYITSLIYVFQAFDVITLFYEAKVLSKSIVIIKNVAFICSAILKVYFILSNYSVIYFAFAKIGRAHV